MPVLVLISRVMYRSTLHLAVAGSIVYSSNTWEGNFSLDTREDFHERESNGSFKIAYRTKSKHVLLVTV